MKIKSSSRARRQAGYSALFITLVLVGASLLVLGATLSRSTASSRLTDRNTLFIASDGAAEAAVEKALARVMVDFANGGESLVLTNLTYYQTQLLPTSAESSYWTNFTWSDGQGHDNQIYVARTTSGANAPYVALEEQYQGLSGYASTYRILSNVRMKSSTFGYTFTNAVQQDVQLAQIPVFQFAIFYNGLLEFSDTATLVVTGPVHANSNIYVGSPDNLTFNSIVTTTGNVSKPGNAGYSTNSWSGQVYYNGTPTPGFLTGQPSLNLPIGTNSSSSTNVQQILYPPPTNEVYSSAMGQQRYWNKADLTIVVSNTFFTCTFKSAANDPLPWVFSTNINYLTNSYATQTGAKLPWLSATNSFYDWRENKTVNLMQVDVGALTNWMGLNGWLTTNAYTSAKFGNNNPFNIIYIVDYRTTNSSTLTAVRLVNGANLPAAGLTVATPNPLYIQGVYNCPNSAYLDTTNTTQSAPASVACDALTILSPSWQDYGPTYTNGTKKSGGKTVPNVVSSELAQNAANDTVNAAIIAGIVPSTGTTASTYSGGANNLPRLLEDWGNSVSATLTLNTSIVCLYNSTWATGPFVLPGTYYYAPSQRNFSFDLNYTLSSKMPPGTPNICRLVRAAWCNPPPQTVTFAPSPTLDFVPQ
ncbi:MAG TPA: hypothetical protein VH413_06145 [Verrucomicrobiae bacterium]|jgi:hypothetical protein|nr:hypothetical protein [Verrucomicrobiae bacterium]